jgi:hypothetical protein
LRRAGPPARTFLKHSSAASAWSNETEAQASET